jgi:UMP-CMP kinase
LTIENIMNEGQIVPSHITVSLIKKAMERSQKRKFLIDGFPRNEENLQVWHETMDSVASIDRVLVLQVSDQTVRERIGHRRSAEGEERKDDSEAVLKKRLVTHRELCQPVIDFFLRGGSAGTDVLSVDGSGSEDEVFEELRDGFEYKVIFVLGPPGAGKGTQCNNLVSHFKGEITHLSAGDLLRAERNSGSENGELINNMIKEGQIVPAEITVNLLKRAMEENPNRRFLIDGFPRNTENLQVWEQIMQDCSETEFVLWFVANDQVVTDRLLDRGKTSGRVDDNLESIKKRLKTYTDSTIPIIQHFQARDKVREIDGSNSVEETFQRVLECF